MGKKFFVFIIAASLFFAVPQSGYAAAENAGYDLEVNGVIQLSPNSMYSENGYSLIYYRFFFESLGMSVDLNQDTGRIYVFSDENGTKPLFTFWLGSKKLLYKGKEYTLPVTVRRIGNLTYIPIRTFSELLGYRIEMDRKAQLVRLNKTIPENKEKLILLLDSLLKEGKINAPREIFNDTGWEDYTNFSQPMGLPFDFMPLDTYDFSVKDTIFLSGNRAYLKAVYSSTSVAFNREIEFVFSAKKERETWKLSGLYLGDSHYELSARAKQENAVTAEQKKTFAEVLKESGEESSEFWIPYLSGDHAVAYTVEMRNDVDDNGEIIQVPVDVIIRLDKTLDGIWKIHSKLELNDSGLTFGF